MGHKQDAEDVVSETVIAAYENLPQLRNEKAFHAWIFKILVNICNKKLRQKVERPIESGRKSQSIRIMHRHMM